MTSSVEALVDKGRARMKNSEVAICALIRDGEKALERNIPAINELVECFNKCDVVIVENDSIDRTKELLLSWKEEVAFVHLIMQNFGSSTIPGPVRASHPKARYFSCSRIEKMASYRNLYMEFISRNLDPDYVIMIDLDIYHFTLEGVCSSFGYEDWDSISANGRKLTPRNILRPYYFDTYALLEIDEELPMRYPDLIRKQKKYSKLSWGDKPVKVKSAFNGLCIYPWDAIKNLRYRSIPNDDSIVSCLCEHVDFHLQMAQKGCDKHFINPSMELIYERTGLRFFIEKAKDRWF